MSSLGAVVFDMDGLLIDSEPQWAAAELATVSSLGADWGVEQSRALHGTNLPIAADYMIGHARSGRSRGEVIELLSDNFTSELARGVTFQPGALALLADLAHHGVRTALVTSSVRVHVEMVLGHLPAGTFAATVTADDVAQLKPHPMPYLAALELLTVAPTSVVVLEDSAPGVASAEAAGCHVVAVPTLTDIEPGPRRTVVTSLTDLNAQRLRTLLLGGDGGQHVEPGGTSRRPQGGEHPHDRR